MHSQASFPELRKHCPGYKKKMRGALSYTRTARALVSRGPWRCSPGAYHKPLGEGLLVPQQMTQQPPPSPPVLKSRPTIALANQPCSPALALGTVLT